jgi:mannose/fructose/N-acetylgalactosamine-specific phosphotransferase system component IID
MYMIAPRGEPPVDIPKAIPSKIGITVPTTRESPIPAIGPIKPARANGTEDVDDETINGLRAGLMGPIAGIGDSLVVGTVIPILLGIALGMSTGGSPLGAIMYIIVWNLFAYFGMKFLYFKGYELGGKAARKHIAMLKAMIERIKKILSLLLKAISNSSNI